MPLLTYLREAGSDRIGGMDLQDSAREYVPRVDTAPFPEMLQAAADFAEGTEISGLLADALVNGTSIGGARPKALVREESVDGPQEMIAKSSLDADPFPAASGSTPGTTSCLYLARRTRRRIPGRGA
jgi:serine/threonine-protein kinase HipA